MQNSSLWIHNSKRVGRRRSPLQLGLALAPALTCCLSLRALREARIPTAGHQWGTGALVPLVAGAPLSAQHRNILELQSCNFPQSNSRTQQHPDDTLDSNVLAPEPKPEEATDDTLLVDIAERTAQRMLRALEAQFIDTNFSTDGDGRKRWHLPSGALRDLMSLSPEEFLHLAGEPAQVTGAQLSRRAHKRAVEDYASVMLRSANGILGTVEVGNTFPRIGTDGEWKLAGRDAILTMKDGIIKLAAAEGDETLAGADITAPYFFAVRDALDHWRRGAPPPISVHDLLPAVRLIDQAYQRAAEVDRHADKPA
jgi:hypothetical protein